MKKSQIALLCLGAALFSPGFAKSFKCVDSKGVTHYGDKIPGECADRPVYELDDKGLVVRENPASLTDEQRRELEIEHQKQAEEANREKDQKRKDKAILNTYASEAEIDMALQRNLQQLQLSLTSIESRKQTAQNRLSEYQKQADDLKKAKKPVPAYLAENIRNSEKEVGKIETERAQKQQETEGIRAKFEADKKRFRELTEGKPESKPVEPEKK